MPSSITHPPMQVPPPPLPHERDKRTGQNTAAEKAEHQPFTHCFALCSTHASFTLWSSRTGASLNCARNDEQKKKKSSAREANTHRRECEGTSWRSSISERRLFGRHFRTFAWCASCSTAMSRYLLRHLCLFEGGMSHCFGRNLRCSDGTSHYSDVISYSVC